MNQGQYQFERGLNYGGSTPRQQTRFLVEEIGPLLKGYSGNILFLDVHTGLGETGTLHVMTGLKPASAMLASARSMLGSLEPERIKLTSSSDPGFYADTGDVIDFVPTLAANPDKALALTMEFGTLGTGTLQQLEAASRMVLENQAHFYGCSEPAVCRQVRTDFLELFNPSDPQWRTAVARQADRLLSVVAARF